MAGTNLRGYISGCLLLVTVVGFSYGQEFLWSEWTKWSPCSQSCGSGITYRKRDCLAKFGSNSFLTELSKCHGSSETYKVCQLPPCMTDIRDDRDYQCYKKTNYGSSGGVKWKAYVADRKLCTLFCRAEGYSPIGAFGKVVDGTICSDERKHEMAVCLNGTCTKIGCDGTTSSRKKLDMCLVCGGDNKNCRQKKAVYISTNRNVTRGYEEVGVIPFGSTNIRITANTGNILAIQDSKGFHVLNTNRFARPTTDFQLANAAVTFRRNFEKHRKNIVEILGITEEDLQILVLRAKKRVVIDSQWWFSEANADKVRVITKVDSVIPELADNTSGTDTEIIVNKTALVEEIASGSATAAKLLGDRDPTAKPLKNKRIPKVGDTRHELAEARPDGKDDKDKKNKKRNKGKTRTKRKNPCFRKSKRSSGKYGSKLEEMKHQYCASTIVARILPMSKTKIGNHVRYEIHVVEAVRSLFPLANKEYLWDNTKCGKPALRLHKEYLVMARSETDFEKRQSRFVITADSYVKRHSDRRLKKLHELSSKTVCAELSKKKKLRRLRNLRNLRRG